MNRICIKWVLAATLICSCLTSLSAQPTREHLAQIRVDKEGNFKYWKSDAASLAQLKSFVTAVKPTATSVRSVVRDTESNGHVYTVSGMPAAEQARGVVISNHQKILRK